MSEQIQLGTQRKQAAQAKELDLDARYKAYNPKVSDLSQYFFNVFIEGGDGKQKYAPLIGEQANAIAALVAFTMGDAPVIIRSWAGTGKTVISNTLWSLIPADMRYEVEMGSALALWSQTQAIREARFIFFNELQNSADNAEVEKVLKLWGEGRAAHRSVTDVTRGGPEDDRNAEQVLDYKPFFTTVAVENTAGKKLWNDEFSRRMIDLYTDVSEDQTARITKYMLAMYERGVKTLATMTDSQKEVLREHIKRSVYFRDEHVKEYRFPAASAMVSQIPTKFVQSRSAIGLLIRMMNAFAVFNYKNRILTTDGILLVAPEDLYLTWACYGKRFAQKCFNMEMLADELLQAFPDVKNVGRPSREEQKSMAQIKTEMKKLKINIPTNKLKTLLDSFTDSGILECAINPEMEGEQLYYKTGIDKFEQNFDYKDIIEHCKKVVQEQYPQYAEDYIKRFCVNPVVEHPFMDYAVNLATGTTTKVERPWPKL
jgi:hypothetical protein